MVRVTWFFPIVGLTLSGCIPSQVVLYRTPLSVDPLPETVAPVNVDYEVLGAATGRVCGDIQQLAVSGAGSSIGGVHPTLYEAARYAAIESIPLADNLMYVRVKAENDGYEQCVTVTGRAYRVRRMRAGAADHSSIPEAVEAAPTAPAAVEP